MPSVLLVDAHGNPAGTADIVDAHTGQGKLHRAFSVYVFRKNGTELLLQRRAAGKRLFPGLWTNTCCSHPQEGETATQAGIRRLREELGFTCPLDESDAFIYRAEDPAGRGVEHEHDTVLVGLVSDADIVPDPDEVSDWKWMLLDDLTEKLERSPDLFTPWFAQGLTIALQTLT